VMMLIRAARAYTGRDIVIRFEGSYHGTSDAVVDPTAPGIPHSTAESVVVVPQGDTAAVADLLRDRPADVAGVLIDLMPNRAGLRRAPSRHVEGLRRLTAEHGALLLVDEVITYRLGVGGLVAEYDIRPDLISLGKVIGGGFPVGAIGGNTEVLAPFAPQTAGAVAWGGTFSANPVTMAAGLAVLRHLDRHTIARLNAQGDELRERLTAEGVPVNGSGSLLQLVSPDRTALWWALYERGVLLGTNGLLALSTPMAEAHIDAIREAVMDVARTSPALLTAT
jgi:glutamate-1-semialdehyde 2,1-aminomutase